MRVYLIRHAQTAWNAEGRAQGHTDIELDEEGRAQAAALGHRYKGAFHEVLTSDLIRSADTAKALGCTNTWTDKRLRERCFGEWEGEPFESIHGRMYASGKPHFECRPPGGESFSDVWHRVEPLVQELFEGSEPRHEGVSGQGVPSTVAIVTHGGTCAILLAQLLKGTHATTRGFRFGNTAVTELERRPDGLFVMVRYNDTTHLHSPARQGDLDGSRA